MDPKYAKGYYRRGVGKYALARHKEAAKDFRVVVKLAPNDKDAKLKLDDCEKTVARLAFEKAIASNEVVKKISESIDPKTFIVEDSYDGVRIDDGKITKAFVDDMIERFVAQKKVHKRYAYEVGTDPAWISASTLSTALSTRPMLQETNKRCSFFAPSSLVDRSSNQAALLGAAFAR